MPCRRSRLPGPPRRRCRGGCRRPPRRRAPRRGRGRGPARGATSIASGVDVSCGFGPYHGAVELQPLFTEEEIRAAVGRVGREISAAYAGERPLLVGVLKGCFVFLADLVRELTIPF